MRAWVFLSLLVAGRALAHGAPPAATEVLARDERGVSLVRMSRGFAYRAEDGFRFLCPEAWDGNLLASAASIPGGAAFVGSNSLFVVDRGRVSEHPVQSGAAFALASGRDAVFGLFKNAERWEIRRLTATTNELVRALDQPIDALAVGEQLYALRWDDRTVVVDTIALTGEPRASVTWQASSSVAAARLRVTGGQLYAVLYGHSSPWVMLGRVGASYEPMNQASVDIQGPVALPTGLAVGVDGAGVELGRVTCLDELEGQPYACADGDVVTLQGETLFTLDALREPDYTPLSDSAREDCAIRWNDLSIDLAAYRAPPPDAGVEVVDATVEGDAAVTASPRSEGCSTSSRTDGSSLLFVLLALFRRTGSRSRAGRSACRG